MESKIHVSKKDQRLNISLVFATACKSLVVVLTPAWLYACFPRAQITSNGPGVRALRLVGTIDIWWCNSGRCMLRMTSISIILLSSYSGKISFVLKVDDTLFLRRGIMSWTELALVNGKYEEQISSVRFWNTIEEIKINQMNSSRLNFVRWKRIREQALSKVITVSLEAYWLLGINNQVEGVRTI